MLAGMNILSRKGLKLHVKKEEEVEEDDEFGNFNTQKFQNLIPETPINTQMDEVKYFYIANID